MTIYNFRLNAKISISWNDYNQLVLKDPKKSAKEGLVFWSLVYLVFDYKSNGMDICYIYFNCAWGNTSTRNKNFELQFYVYS